jgi:hypothetical protein
MFAKILQHLFCFFVSFLLPKHSHYFGCWSTSSLCFCCILVEGSTSPPWTIPGPVTGPTLDQRPWRRPSCQPLERGGLLLTLARLHQSALPLSLLQTPRQSPSALPGLQQQLSLPPWIDNRPWYSSHKTSNNNCHCIALEPTLWR